MHRINRLFESSVYEPDGFTTTFRDKSDAVLAGSRRMLAPFPVMRRYRFDCGYQVPFRIKARVIRGTLDKYPRDTLTVFCNSLTDHKALMSKQLPTSIRVNG